MIKATPSGFSKVLIYIGSAFILVPFVFILWQAVASYDMKITSINLHDIALPFLISGVVILIIGIVTSLTNQSYDLSGIATKLYRISLITLILAVVTFPLGQLFKFFWCAGQCTFGQHMLVSIGSPSLIVVFAIISVVSFLVGTSIKDKVVSEQMKKSKRKK